MPETAKKLFDRPIYFDPVPGVNYARDYNAFWCEFHDTAALDKRLEMLANLFVADLFFCVHYGLGRYDINDWGPKTQWIVDVCQEVESGPQTDTLDLWARGHYKSSILTQGRTLQELLDSNGEMSVGIFSHTRPIAKSFLRPIKTALETNLLLKIAFRSLLWPDPQRQAPAWSMDDGLVLMRQGTSNTNNLEAWGLVDSMPTGKHFSLRVYDDVVTERSVTTPEMIQKVEDSIRMSDNLGTVQGGRQRFIGTIYHHADPYRTRLDQARKGVYPWHARVKPWYDTRPEVIEKYGRIPVLLSMDEVERKRRRQGPYIFACFDGSTRILMSDWTTQPISRIRAGDYVIGWTMEEGERSRLVSSKVLSVKSRRVDSRVRSWMKNGSRLIHTPDHKFWTGRRQNGKDSHLPYAPLGFKARRDQQGLCQLIDLNIQEMSPSDKFMAGYLGGVFDGEGSSGNPLIRFTQSLKNPEVCHGIERALDAMQFDWSVLVSKRTGKETDCHSYYIKGGRQEAYRFLAQCQPFRRHKIVNAIMKYSSRDFGKGNRVELREQEDLGPGLVYNIMTETGNYIAEGFCSKNCQQELDPTNEELQTFKRAWLRYYQELPDKRNKYLFVDPANDKKKDSDYTAMALVSIDARGNRFLEHLERNRMNLGERWRVMSSIVRQHPDLLVVYYERYGKDADSYYHQEQMAREGLYFDLQEIGGTTSKADRIRRLVPVFEAGRFFLPDRLYCDGRDVIAELLDEEYDTFPFSRTYDMLDAISRIEDPAVKILVPKVIDGGFEYNKARAKAIREAEDEEY